MTRLPIGLATATAVVCALAACSSSGNGSPKDPPGQLQTSTHQQTSTQPSSTSAGASPAGSKSASTTTATTAATAIHVCDLLPAATVAQLSGIAVKKAASDDRGAPTIASLVISQCNYTGDLEQLDVTYSKSAFSEHQFDQDYSIDKSVVTRTKMVAGFGDKAFTTNFPTAWLEVLWGGATYKISGASNVTIANAEKVVSALHGKV